MASLFWAGLILLLSGLPSGNFPNLNIWEIIGFDKFAHAFFYAVLTILIAIGEVKYNRFSSKRARSVRTAFWVTFIYGASLEVLQAILFYGRSADWIDILANTIGCLLGVVYFKWNFNDCLKKARW